MPGARHYPPSASLSARASRARARASVHRSPARSIDRERPSALRNVASASSARPCARRATSDARFSSAVARIPAACHPFRASPPRSRSAAATGAGSSGAHALRLASRTWWRRSSTRASARFDSTLRAVALPPAAAAWARRSRSSPERGQRLTRRAPPRGVERPPPPRRASTPPRALAGGRPPPPAPRPLRRPAPGRPPAPTLQRPRVPVHPPSAPGLHAPVTRPADARLR